MIWINIDLPFANDNHMKSIIIYYYNETSKRLINWVGKSSIICMCLSNTQTIKYCSLWHEKHYIFY